MMLLLLFFAAALGADPFPAHKTGEWEWVPIDGMVCMDGEATGVYVKVSENPGYCAQYPEKILASMRALNPQKAKKKLLTQQSACSLLFTSMALARASVSIWTEAAHASTPRPAHLPLTTPIQAPPLAQASSPTAMSATHSRITAGSWYPTALAMCTLAQSLKNSS